MFLHCHPEGGVQSFLYCFIKLRVFDSILLRSNLNVYNGYSFYIFSVYENIFNIFKFINLFTCCHNYTCSLSYLPIAGIYTIYCGYKNNKGALFFCLL